MNIDSVDSFNSEIERIKSELTAASNTQRERIFKQIIGAVLGTIPWIGGFISLGLAIKDGEEQAKTNKLYEQWFSEHTKKMSELSETILAILQRLSEFPDEINERLESEEYLGIVRKAFRIWDSSDTFEKKEIIRKLITNAGAQSLVYDDLIRLFLDWINTYHEIHFAIIKAVYENTSITRHGIWQSLNGKYVSENSMEADVFKLIIRDLNLGGVIRQHREVDYYGNFYKKIPAKKGSGTNTMKSAFDDQEQYELTELGKQFVHYTLNELVSRIDV